MRKIISLLLTAIIAVSMFSVSKIEVSAAEDEAAYWKSFSNDYHYNMMSDKQKTIYDIMDRTLMNILLDERDYDEIAFDLSSLKMEPTEETAVLVMDTFTLLCYANPQYFFLGYPYFNAWHWGTDDGSVYYGGLIYGAMPDFQKGADRKKAREEVKALLDSYIKEIPSNALPAEKEKLVHDLMCERITYGTYVLPSGTETDQTIYSALKNKTVCAGYATLFAALMNKVGVNCIVSVGLLGGGAHAWNMINLHGYWYNVDVTDDDCFNPTAYVSYNHRNGPTPIGYWEKHCPPLLYDELDEGHGYTDYCSRYITIDSDTYFIVNDYDTEEGRLVLCLNSESSDKNVIPYNGRSYNVINYRDPGSKKSFSEFVERLYVVALGRASEKDGKDFWCEKVGNGTYSGADCARGFLYSDEFLGKKMSNEEFIKTLYRTFFNREAAKDPDGYNYWLSNIDAMGRTHVIECFINSVEWCDICSEYGVRSGAQYVKATVASEDSIAFAIRLYTECLGREPEEEGLKFWSLSLTNLERSGSQAAREFFYSEEFMGFGLDDEEYVTRLYKTFMGREPEKDGFDYWIDSLSKGTGRNEVFDFFCNCPEFASVCQQYGIQR